MRNRRTNMSNRSWRKAAQNAKPVEYITIQIDSRPRITVKRADYVRAKTGDLREFGYANLAESDVDAQLGLLLRGEKWTDVIGGFIERDNPERTHAH